MIPILQIVQFWSTLISSHVRQASHSSLIPFCETQHMTVYALEMRATTKRWLINNTKQIDRCWLTLSVLTCHLCLLYQCECIFIRCFFSKYIKVIRFINVVLTNANVPLSFLIRSTECCKWCGCCLSLHKILTTVTTWTRVCLLLCRWGGVCLGPQRLQPTR